MARERVQTLGDVVSRESVEVDAGRIADTSNCKIAAIAEPELQQRPRLEFLERRLR